MSSYRLLKQILNAISVVIFFLELEFKHHFIVFPHLFHTFIYNIENLEYFTCRNAYYNNLTVLYGLHAGSYFISIQSHGDCLFRDFSYCLHKPNYTCDLISHSRVNSSIYVENYSFILNYHYLVCK